MIPVVQKQDCWKNFLQREELTAGKRRLKIIMKDDEIIKEKGHTKAENRKAVAANKESKKDAILEAGRKLFSERGFAAVGVRDIAKEADVNISMISYHFKGKSGVLKEILSGFFSEYSEKVRNIVNISSDPPVFISNLIESLVPFFREHSREAIIFASEMPVDSSDITEFKAEKIKDLLNIFRTVFRRAGLPSNSEDKLLGIIGPAFFSMVFSHFLFKPVASNTFGLVDDDNFYMLYTKILKTMMKGAVMELQSAFGSAEEIK